MTYGEKNGVQARLALFSLGVGFLVGLLYAFLMGLRRLRPRSAVLTAAEDVLFCLAAAMITFFFLLEYSAGSVRFYLLLSEAAGFSAVRTAAAKIIAANKKKGCNRCKK